MSEVFTINRNGKELEVNKFMFDAYCKLPTDRDCQAFFDNILNMRELSAQAQSKEPLVPSTVEATLAQRGSRYGDFTDHARLCQQLMYTMQGFEKVDSGQEHKKDGDKIRICPWHNLSPVQRQALTVIMDKVARILSGDPNYDDNWHDIQGYAKLVEDRLPKKESN